MGMKKIIGMLALMALAVGANAETITQTLSFTDIGANTFTFDAYDGDETLTDVTWTLTYAVDGGSGSAENTGTTTAGYIKLDLTTSFDLAAQASLGFDAMTEELSTVESFYNVAAGETVSIVGGTLSDSVTQSIDSSDFAAYYGDGYLTSVGMYVLNSFTASTAAEGISTDSTGVAASGTLSLTYTTIPEPATMGLMALVAGGMLIIRRRFY
jgi:hypothetical protein